MPLIRFRFVYLSPAHASEFPIKPESNARAAAGAVDGVLFNSEKWLHSNGMKSRTRPLFRFESLTEMTYDFSDCSYICFLSAALN